MTDVFNNERVLVSFKTKRRLSLEKQGTNMVANCLLGHNRTSGLEPDVYTIYLTDKTFFAEYSRKSLHGGLPKKVTNLDIPLADIKKIEFRLRSPTRFLVKMLIFFLFQWLSRVVLFLSGACTRRFISVKFSLTRY